MSENFSMPPQQLVKANGGMTSVSILRNEKEITELDEVFFYHQPTSFFTIDNRVPRVIRELFPSQKVAGKWVIW